MPQRRENLRLVVDTNVWVSYLLTRSFARLNTLLSDQGVRVLYSEAMIEELMEVLERPRARRQIASADVAELLGTIQVQGERVQVTSSVRVCRDPDDDKVLELCQDGKAHLLVSGDKDLLSMREFQGTKIISPAEFMRLRS
ncbi:MAG: putative toxin-antitoxin system toxin component, PIN family [Bacteroidetes bacterium]|nr:putative toxin-antitoxin system toxin component, PIN family [Bacteroidota bacterium]MBS1945243.1 putative toxin-antitoxin system toxin component, PIN family [Bacteroidota bacterium]